MTDTEDTIDYVELTARLGLPASEQAAVLAWTGEAADTIWTVAEAERLADIRAAATERITQEV
jgi:hypothetical protein